VAQFTRAFRLTAALAGVLVAFPLTASAAQREAPSPGPLAAGARVGHLHDTVLDREAPRMWAARRRARAARVYSTADGYRVEVAVSPSYPADPSADQRLVDFLGSRLHGAELAGLSVYVGRPDEIERLCGGVPGTLACYAIAEARMYVPGEAVDGIPVEYPLTHEYGHHVASWSSNDPWDALDWGAKRWASAVRVCSYVRSGRLFPGNQGDHYLDDPGEGFADGYAHLHYPEMPWQYNELMRPGRSTLAAIRRDVLEPWTAPRARTFHGRLGPKARRRTFRIRLTLDGDLTFNVAGPAGASYMVEAETPGFAVGKRLEAGAGFGVEWCRRRPVEHVTLTVRRRKGAGPFALTVRWPG
jgi:hypothetical protein